MALDVPTRRGILGRIPYGLYILTTLNGHEPHAGTVSWVSQVSFQPPLLLMAVRLDSFLRTCLEQSGVYALHLLDAAQQEMASRFFRRVESTPEQMGGYRYRSGVTGAPVLLDAPAYVEGTARTVDSPGDHALVIGNIVDGALQREGFTPLRLAQTPWSYGG